MFENQKIPKQLVRETPDGGTVDVKTVNEKREILYALEWWNRAHAKKSLTVTVNGSIVNDGVPPRSPTYAEFLAGSQGNKVQSHEAIGMYCRWNGSLVWRQVTRYLENNFGTDENLLKSLNNYHTALTKFVNREYRDDSNKVLIELSDISQQWIDLFSSSSGIEPDWHDVNRFRDLLDKLPQPPLEENLKPDQNPTL